MKYPVSWLRDFVDIDVPVQELADRLSLAGLEVEGVEFVGQSLSHVITARIDSIEKHPNADRLNVTQVFDGKALRQIVCGAQNIFVGAIVPVVLPGAELPNGLKIKESKIRDVVSLGMICSETELGVSESSEGIWLLPNDMPLGVDFVEYAQLKDAILDIGILPNRGDCMSLIGLAREIAAILGTSLKEIKTPDLVSSGVFPLKVSVEIPELCPLYSARFISGITPGLKSPLWMQRRLQLAGLRPLNLIVDVMNYVLLETGQPLQVADRRKISGEQLTVSDVKLGVVGRVDAAVTSETTEIILESAVFDAVATRKASQALSLRTENSVRYEKGIDWDGVLPASDRAASLLISLAGGTTSEQVVVTSSAREPRWLAFDFQQINGLLGSDFSDDEMREVLGKLGFVFESGRVRVPSWRFGDVQEWPCLAEEVARLLGYDRIPSVLPEAFVLMDPPTRQHTLVQKIETYLTAQGFYQTNTFPLSSVAAAEAVKCPLPEAAYVLQNPISPEASAMRKSLLPSLLEVVTFNQKRQLSGLRFFEVGHVFSEVKSVPVCVSHLGVLFESNSDFFVDKGLVEGLLSHLGLSYAFGAVSREYFHPVRSASILVDGREVGAYGVLHPSVSSGLFYLEFDLSLFSGVDKKLVYQAVSKFPSTRRDIAMLAPKSLSYQAILDVINANLSEWVQDVFLFDCFESEKIGLENKSLGFGFIYQTVDRTLSDDEVNTADQALRTILATQLPITLR